MVSVIYYYKLLNDNQVKKLVKALTELKEENNLELKVFSACLRIIEKAAPGNYVILDGFYTEEFNRLEYRTFTIKNASVWKSKPQSYTGNKRDLFKDDCWPYSVQSDYQKLLDIIKSTLILNFKQNGQNQNQLQKQGNSDSKHYEGSILYGGRNRPQLTAGRHCDQAGAEIQRTRVGGGKIYLSSRCPEVHVTPQRGRISEEWSSQCKGTPGGAGIQCDCINQLNKQIVFTAKFCQEDCVDIGDFFMSPNGVVYVVTSYNNNKPIFTILN